MTINNSFPKISVIIPVYNAVSTLENCLKGVVASGYPNYELIVVDDSSTDVSPQVARGYADVVLESSIDTPRGPAHARNRGAEIAQGKILFFVDADVMIKPDTLSEIAQTFACHKDYVATFGSYDENPSDGEFLSQYKNLFHHFVHQQASQDGGTFWSGCGAIYRQVFIELGGFDEARYPRPSIEDIELGYRLRAAGYKIFVNKNIQGKHLKRWTMIGLLKSDILDRGIPWTQLIMQERNLPDDLNLSLSQRISAILLGLLLVYLTGLAVYYNVLLLPFIVVLFMGITGGWQFYIGAPILRMSWQTEALVYLLTISIGVLAYRDNLLVVTSAMVVLLAIIVTGRYLPDPNPRLRKGLFAGAVLVLFLVLALVMIQDPSWILGPVLLILIPIVILNRKFYRFFVSKRGLIFSLAIFPFHMMYYFYSMVSFILGGSLYIWNTNLRTRQS